MKLSAGILAGLLLASAVVAPAESAPAERKPKKVTDLSAFMSEYLGDGAKKDKFQFAVISDTHIGSDAGAVRNAKALLADVAKTTKVDFVINTGDVTEGKKAQAEQYMAMFEELLGRTPHVAVMGNHDRAGKEVMDALYGIETAGEAASCNYSFDYGKWHFTVVHNGVRDMLHPVNRKFLQADLTAAAGRPTLLFYHIHVMCPTPGQAHLSYMGARRHRTLAFFNRFANLKGCFAGHDHAFWHGRFMNRNFFSTVGSWYQCGGTGNGWWWFRIDGEEIKVRRKVVGKPAVEMPAWEKFPLYPTAMGEAVEANGRLEIPLFAEKLTGAGYYWGTQGYSTPAVEGVSPVAGKAMIRCMELNRVHQGVLGCRDFEIAPGDRLAYWMFVPPGGERWPCGVRPAGGWKGFEKLTDQNGLVAYVGLAKAGVSPGNWLYREIPLGKAKGWYSTFTARLPGRYASWPTGKLRSSWRVFLDEVKILRGVEGKPPAAAAVPGKVENLKAAKVGAGYVVLSWELAKGAHHYRVERVEAGAKRFVGTSHAGRFFDFTVKPARQYTYQVAAVSVALKAGPAGSVKVETAEKGTAPAKVAALKGALLPKGRFVFAGTWHSRPAVHISWDGKRELNDLAVKAYRVYRLVDGEKKVFAETTGRYALIDGGKLGEKFAVAAVNHAGEEGPAAELKISVTWKGPGEAFHLRTGEEDSAR